MRVYNNLIKFLMTVYVIQIIHAELKLTEIQFTNNDISQRYFAFQENN